MTNTQPEPQPATFVLVPEDASPDYWNGWATPCGSDIVEGKRYRIVATHRTGSTGASDAQYIIDRMASGLHWAKLHTPRPAPVANQGWPKLFFDGGPTPAEVHDATPESRGLYPVCESLDPSGLLDGRDLNEDGEPILMDSHPDTYWENVAESRKEARGW